MAKHIPLEDSAGGWSDPVDHAADPGPRLTSSVGRWIHIAEWVLVALLTIHFGVRSMPKAWRTLNTDFPDYFVTASLLHEHFDTSRIYEWVWLERQKDHLGVDQRIVNLAPSTPFSTLAVSPFTGMSALAAKHCWIFLNLGLLIATLFLLRASTQLSWRRIALVVALSFPLRMNFLTGQYYVLLLFLLTLACYLYLRQRRFLSGVIVGIASGMKIFPVVYLLYFLRKRDLKAFAGGVTGGVASAVVSLLAFGWAANRTYLFQVLPATLRGEANSPYDLKLASLTSLLHRLFVYEPQLNPHPSVHAAWMLAVLHPLLQMLVIAPALLLAAPEESDAQRVRLEWAGILLACLVISTSPGAYLFTLLIFPACVVLTMFDRAKSYFPVAVLLLLYFTTGYLTGASHSGDGWSALLGVPRLYALVLSCVLFYVFWVRQQPVENSKRDRLAWAVALGVVVALSIGANLRHQQGLYDDYPWRISTPRNVFMATGPAVEEGGLMFVGLTGDGYRSVMQQDNAEHGGIAQFSDARQNDVLAVASAKGERWVEQVGHDSTIVSSPVAGVVSYTASGLTGRSSISPAELPVASFDGRWLAFLREDHGRGRLWVRELGQAGNTDRPVTPSELDVLEMSFLPEGGLIFAAASDGKPGLFTVERIGDQAGNIRSLGMEEARYPAVSPDGHWLAYSQLQGGNWNLWLQDLTSGQTQRLTHAECNTTEPAWAADSKTLVYANDCGRSLSFSALSRRRVVP